MGCAVLKKKLIYSETDEVFEPKLCNLMIVSNYETIPRLISH